MSIEDVIKSLAEDIKGGNFMLQVVFDRHINEIEEMKAQGFAYRRMIALLNYEIDSEIKTTYFKNLIFRAKQKINAQDGQFIKQPKNEVFSRNNSPSTPKKPVVDREENRPVLNESLSDWNRKTGIRISERQALRLEQNGINTDQINALGFNNAAQINKYLTELEFKHKKNVFF